MVRPLAPSARPRALCSRWVSDCRRPISSAIASSISPAWSRGSRTDIVAAAGILVFAKTSHSDRIAPKFCWMNACSRLAVIARPSVLGFGDQQSVFGIVTKVIWSLVTRIGSDRFRANCEGAAENLPGGDVEGTIEQAQRFVQEARAELERVRNAIVLSRMEVARAKLVLAEAKEDLARLGGQVRTECDIKPPV